MLCPGCMRLILLIALSCCRGPSRPAVERSAVSCGPCEARADDFERVRVRVFLRDADGAPVHGVRLLFASADGAVTDEEGAAIASFSSPIPGPRQVEVRLPDGSSVGSVAVLFFAGSLPRVDLSPHLGPR